MLKHRFDVRRRLLFVEPESELSEDDFRKLAKAVDGFRRMHGDLNGVTTIPREIADEIPDVAEEFIAAEAVIITAMRQESVSVKLLQEATAEAHARMDALRQRVARK